MSTDPDRADVKAAGGVVCRGGLLALVHRPRYDDWSFPKGKLDPGESWEDAARREVEEELGLHCRLHEELPSAAYDVAKGRKVVRYWRMEPETDGTFNPNEEVDEVRWMEPAAAQQLLTHEHDRKLARAVSA